MKRLGVFFVVMSLVTTAFAQVDNFYEMYCGKWESGWVAKKVSQEKEVDEYRFYHANEDKNNWTEMCGIMTYKYMINQNIEQITGQFLAEMRPKYGKAKFTEIAKNVYGDEPFVIFMIESENYDKTGKPQCIIQHVVKGMDFTHTAYYITRQNKISGETKRKWEKFFKDTKVCSHGQASFLVDSNIENPAIVLRGKKK